MAGSRSTAPLNRSNSVFIADPLSTAKHGAVARVVGVANLARAPQTRAGKSRTSLERHPRAKLQRAAAARAVDSGAAADGAGNVTVRGVRQVALRITELGRVGEVECLGPEFQVGPLGNRELLGEREVQGEEPGAAD